MRAFLPHLILPILLVRDLAVSQLLEHIFGIPVLQMIYNPAGCKRFEIADLFGKVW